MGLIDKCSYVQDILLPLNASSHELSREETSANAILRNIILLRKITVI